MTPEEEQPQQKREYKRLWAANKRAEMKAAGIAPKKRPTTDEQREWSNAWKAANKERVKASRAEYYAKNKEKEKQTNAKYRAENPELTKKQKQKSDKRYRLKNIDKIKEHKHLNKDTSNQKQRERYSKDVRYAMTMRLRASLTQAVRLAGARKTKKTMELVGCSPQELVVYLESKFMPGMSWDNRKDWHIDHIRPCCSFDLSDPEQQKLCFHHSNLRPLWKQLNFAKGGRYDQSLTQYT